MLGTYMVLVVAIHGVLWENVRGGLGCWDRGFLESGVSLGLGQKRKSLIGKGRWGW